MQRVLLVFVLVLLLAVSLAVGAAAAAWPFWSRALAWRDAPEGWPASLPGPARELQAADEPLPLRLRVDPALSEVAQASGAQWLILADGPDAARAWFAPGLDEHSLVDGRGLAPALLPLVYAALEADHPGILDQPLSQRLREWSRDPRGAITPRQLMWQLSGLAGGSRQPWNPFDPQAQLLAGPDFTRAALDVRQVFPVETVHVWSPANAQLLALLAGRLSSGSYADLLDTVLWRRLAASDAHATLDHPRGDIAAHCCISATAGDWFRVALMLAQRGSVGGRSLLPPERLQDIGVGHMLNPTQGLVWQIERVEGIEVLMLRTTGRMLAAVPASGAALFWAGEGQLPVDQAVRLLQ
ncbi:MAG: serine hydrolase [Nevskiaceae bacterium]|jgi:CubicO group peptidase (beta-lactamase class C family)|nr:serine hydrolase [Nevskiaceae bacterium]